MEGWRDGGISPWPDPTRLHVCMYCDHAVRRVSQLAGGWLKQSVEWGSGGVEEEEQEEQELLHFSGC